MIAKRLLLAMLAALSAASLAAQAPAPQTTTSTPKPAEEPNYVWTDSKEHRRPKIVGSEPQYLVPETAEQRKARLGTPEDPGTDPDPNKHFWRYGKSYHIEKFDRRFEAWDTDPGRVRPLAMVNVSYEVYQINDRWVWVWTADPVEEAPPEPVTQYTTEALNYFRDIRA